MADLLRDGAAAMIALMVGAAVAQERTEDAVRRAMRHVYEGGTVRAQVTPRGLLGILWGDVRKVRIVAQSGRLTGIPMALGAADGPSVRAGCAIAEISNTLINGDKVSRAIIEVPRVMVDPWQILWSRRVVVRSTGVGTVSATLSNTDMALMVSQKMPVLERPLVSSSEGRLVITSAPTNTSPSGMRVETGLVVDGPSTVRLVKPRAWLGEVELPALVLGAIASSFEPVFDLSRYSGWAQAVTLRSVTVGPSGVTLQGTARPAPVVRR